MSALGLVAALASSFAIAESGEAPDIASRRARHSANLRRGLRQIFRRRREQSRDSTAQRSVGATIVTRLAASWQRLVEAVSMAEIERNGDGYHG